MIVMFSLFLHLCLGDPPITFAFTLAFVSKLWKDLNSILCLSMLY